MASYSALQHSLPPHCTNFSVTNQNHSIFKLIIELDRITSECITKYMTLDCRVKSICLVFNYGTSSSHGICHKLLQGRGFNVSTCVHVGDVNGCAVLCGLSPIRLRFSVNPVDRRRYIDNRGNRTPNLLLF
jgi:hypothetical protein